VTVNGLPAQVSNRSFFVQNLGLVAGPNPITVVARDTSGNVGQASVTVNFDATPKARIGVASGGNQTATIGQPLAQPLVAVVTDATGQPVVGANVASQVVGNNGALDGGKRQFTAKTDAMGKASAHFTLGTRVGVCNQLVQASVTGFAGPATFCA